MDSIEQQLVADLESRIRTLTLDDAVRLVETRHPGDGPGVERDVLESYFEAIGFGMDAFRSSFEEVRTDADSWQESGHVYELDGGRVSFYPRHWHHELGDTTDLREYLRVIGADAATTEGGNRETVTEDGVMETMLLDAAAAIGGVDSDHARDQLRELRHEGEVKAFPSQHANPWVKLS
ncbi:hypothetical protein [Haladaptatus sp. NG-WS-4]